MSVFAAIEPATVVERTEPMAGAVELVLHHPQAASTARPGQFFQLAVNAPHTLLRRPYSVAWTDAQRGRLGFIFSVVGAGSAWLSARHEGHQIDLIGPLGLGFDLSQVATPAVCVAGGLGVAAFPALVAALAAHRRPVTFLQGARTASRLLPAARLAPADVRLATDDGTAGSQGSVVDRLRSLSLRGTELFICGPGPMMRAVIDLADRLELPRSSIQVALETPMGCGVGTCLGCAAPKAAGGFLLTCQEGPCVRADRIDWSRMTDDFHG